MILILTHPMDAHALAVAEGLRRSGADARIWYASDFPTRARESLCLDARGTRIVLAGPQTVLGDSRIDTVWDRRSAFVPDRRELHPADRAFATAQCREFREGLFAALAPKAFWVNRRTAAQRANHKIVQHLAAADLGMEIPPTLYSNDPDEVRAFARAHAGEIVYKTFGGGAGWRGDGTTRVTYTTALRDVDLEDDRALMLAPGIYQAKVEKAYELRVTVLGRRLFGVKLHSQETAAGRLDWRRAYGELRVEPLSVPAPVERACLALMDRLDLAFGCFDFIVTREDRHVFLEVNPMGQFLWIEDMAGVPILDAFCQFLIQGRSDFAWDHARVAVRLADIDVREPERAARAEHVAPADQFADETAGIAS